MNDKITKAYNKIYNDLQLYEQSIMELSKQDIINMSFEIAHAQNFLCHFEFLLEICEEDDCYDIEEHILDKIIDFKDNFISYWVSHRYDIRHSERYNLENFDDFVTVLTCVVDNIGD